MKPEKKEERIRIKRSRMMKPKEKKKLSQNKTIKKEGTE